MIRFSGECPGTVSIGLYVPLQPLAKSRTRGKIRVRIVWSPEPRYTGTSLQERRARAEDLCPSIPSTTILTTATDAPTNANAYDDWIIVGQTAEDLVAEYFPARSGSQSTPPQHYPRMAQVLLPCCPGVRHLAVDVTARDEGRYPERRRE